MCTSFSLICIFLQSVYLSDLISPPLCCSLFLHVIPLFTTPYMPRIIRPSNQVITYSAFFSISFHFSTFTCFGVVFQCRLLSELTIALLASKSCSIFHCTVKSFLVDDQSSFSSEGSATSFLFAFVVILCFILWSSFDMFFIFMSYILMPLLCFELFYMFHSVFDYIFPFCSIHRYSFYFMGLYICFLYLLLVSISTIKQHHVSYWSNLLYKCKKSTAIFIIHIKVICTTNLFPINRDRAIVATATLLINRITQPLHFGLQQMLLCLLTTSL